MGAYAHFGIAQIQAGNGPSLRCGNHLTDLGEDLATQGDKGLEIRSGELDIDIASFREPALEEA